MQVHNEMLLYIRQTGKNSKRAVIPVANRDVGGETVLSYVEVVKRSSLFWKAIWHALLELKIHIPLDPRILLLGIYSIKIKVLICKDTCARMFIAGLFVAAKNWKHGEWPLIREWLKN